MPYMIDPKTKKRIDLDPITGQPIGMAGAQQQHKDEGNIFQRLAKAIMAPAVKSGRTIATGAETAADWFQAATKQNTNAFHEDLIPKKYKLNQQEEEQIRANPVQEAVKQSAGLASYIFPAGKLAKGAGFLAKVGQGIKTGLGSGALYGLSQSEKNDVAGMGADTLTGGIAGGVGGGVLSSVGAGAGKLVKSVGNKGSKRIMNTLFKESVKDTKSSITKGLSLGEEALKRGVKGKSATSIYNQAINKVEEYEDEIAGAISPSKRIIPIVDIKKMVKPLIKKYSDAGDFNAVKSITDRIANLENQHGKSIPIQIAQEVKRTLYEELAGGYGTLKNAEKEGLKTIARSLKEGIASKVKSKDLNKINKELSVWGRIRDSMLDKMTREERNQIMGRGELIMNAAGAISGTLPITAGLTVGAKALGSTAVKTASSNALNKIAKMEIPSAINSTILNTQGRIGVETGKGISNYFFGGKNQPQQPAGQGSTEPQTSQPTVVATDPNGEWQTMSDGKSYSMDNQWVFDEASDDWVPNPAAQGGMENDQANPEAPASLAQYNAALSKLAGSSSTAAVRQYGLLEQERDYYYPREKSANMSEGDKKFAFAGKEAKKALDALDSVEKIPVGPVSGSGIAQGYRMLTGGMSNEETNFLSKVAIARTAARNALLGANMSDKEIESLLEFTFDASKPKEVLRQRIASFIDSMDTYVSEVAGPEKLQNFVFPQQ